MNASRMVSIGLAAALAAAVGYALYLHQGPIKKTSRENQNLTADIDKLKAASKDTDSTHKVELDTRAQQIRTLQTKNEALQERIAEVSQEKKEAETELAKLVAQIREEKERIEANLQSKVGGLENQLVQKQRELETTQNETQQLKAALDEVKADHHTELADKIRLVEALQRKSSELEITVTRTRKETEAIEAELRGTIKNLEDQLAQREIELQTSRDETQKLKAATDEANAAYKAEIVDKISLVEELQRKSVKLEETVLRIKKETASLETDLRTTIKNLKDQLAQWDRELIASRGEVQKLRDAIANLEENQKTLRQKSEYLDRQLQASKNQITGLQYEISDQNLKLEKATEAHHTLMQQYRNLQEKRAQLEQNLIELKNELAQSQSQNQAMSDDAAAKGRKLDEIEKDRQRLLSKVAHQEKEKEELSRLKDALKNQLGMTQSQIEDLSMDAAAKEKQLKSKDQRLKSMEQAYAELSKQFEQQIKEKEIKISSLENKLNIRLMDRILFSSGSADISSVGYRVLQSLANELQKMDGFEIAVAGHTDNKPLGPKVKRVYYDNLGLSVARAASVSRALRKMGVSPDHLSAVGYSEYRPVTNNNTRQGRQQNRRVEIMLEPLH